MYIYDQAPPSDVSPGIGWLDAFGKSRKKEAEQLAEARRLEEEMDKLYAKAAWNGVNRAYRLWLENRAEGKWQVYKMAAEAAAHRGDALSRYVRLITALMLFFGDQNLSAANRQKQLDDMASDRSDLESNWAYVDIRLLRKSNGHLQYKSHGFTVVEEDQRAAIELAKENLRSEKKFQGLLPIGNYTIDGEPVSLGREFTITTFKMGKKAIIWKKRNQFLYVKPEIRERIMPLEGMTSTSGRWLRKLLR